LIRKNQRRLREQAHTTSSSEIQPTDMFLYIRSQKRKACALGLTGLQRALEP
jgi:hypothetical protein